MNTATTDHALDTLLQPSDIRRALESDAHAGLTASPKWLPPKYFYDDLGSVLFDEITRLEEYYPTRTERSILAQYADAIASAAQADALLELGSGSSEKTRLLLDAMARTGALKAYVPVDVSSGALSDAMAELGERYPDLTVRGAVADFDHHLADLPRPGRRLWVLLGGTIGNYPPAERAEFLRKIAAAMEPGEAFLLGLDLVKDADRLVRAYDDADGVTARFNLNVLSVLNRELGGDLDPADFEHVAVWDADHEWIEMRLRARTPVHAHLSALDLDVDFARGEEIRTEISAKFRHERIEAELAAAQLSLEEWWSDPAGDFALVLARKESR